MVIYEPRTLKVLRGRQQLRVEDLATRARLSARQLRSLEQGAIPRADTLAKLASALGVPVESFFVERRRAS